MKVLFSMILSFLFSISSFASWREGNGGDVVKTENGHYLLDLVEAGNELRQEAFSPITSGFYFDQVLDLQNKVGASLPVDQLVHHFHKIAQKNTTLALVLMDAFKKISWRFVNIPLKDIQDEGPHLTIPREQLIQAAFRINQTVQIHRQTWDLLDQRNQAALLFHEVIFALMNPLRNSEGIDMNSSKVRILTAHLFSEQFEESSLSSYLESEAPHLIFPTSVNSQINPKYNASQTKIIFNRAWYAEIPGQDSQSFELIMANSQLVAAWKHLICQRASQERTGFRFGIQAETVSNQFVKTGTDLTEEFYLAPRHQWASSLAVVEMPRPEASESGIHQCVQKITDFMGWLSAQALQ